MSISGTGTRSGVYVRDASHVFIFWNAGGGAGSSDIQVHSFRTTDSVMDAIVQCRAEDKESPNKASPNSTR
ncbi:hypothetical protein C1H76_8741 [Elsinoe australis]|uniref:Uncharacterized protein n=1 Tax=Elsinoe australis TaxID=40998 RepID=A0A4U7AQ83_9PEZI|nr:hypothetical protein C1H76_8741 [Elsinoe australis]